MSNADLIRGLYEAFAAGDVPTVMGALDENISWTEAEGFPYGGTYVGPAAVVENVFIKLGTEWDGFAVAPERIVDGGETVVGLGNYSGTYKETGKSMKVPFAHVWDIRDGKVVKFVQHTDTAIVAEALEA
jgi:ketosteroid isomerase-like protein